MSVHFKQDEPDTSNRLDDMKQGVIGAPLPRVEGMAKVTGTAPYAAEYPVENCAEGVLVTSTITRGEVTRIDKDSVLSMPGVIAVIDDERLITRPAQGTANEAPQQKPKRAILMTDAANPRLQDGSPQFVMICPPFKIAPKISD